MAPSMHSLAQQIQLDRRAIFYALGSVAAIVVVLKKTLFRGSKADEAPTATKATVKDILAENPLLLQVALGQGIPLSELMPESAESPAQENTAAIESLPSAADAMSIHEHPAVKKADKRMHKSRLLRKMDEDVKELMREVVYLRAVTET